MNNDFKFYKELSTGNVFTLDSGSIDNNNFVELVPNTVDAAYEKHVPVYEINGNKMIVRVGEIAHPMIPEHYIMWIAQVNNNKMTMVKLNPGDKPEAEFEYIKGSEIYAYCNLHGLWKNIVE